jgi:hypothetical protein
MPFLPNTGLASEELFSEGSLETLLQRQSADALEEVDTIDADQLLEHIPLTFSHTPHAQRNLHIRGD